MTSAHRSPLPVSAAPLGGQRGVLGYLPGHSDLVRVRASSREVRALESWLERGLHQARWEMGGGFFTAYPRLWHRFIFRPDNSTQVVLGVLYASQDAHQRPFPFVAFELLPTRCWDQQGLAILRWNEPLFAELEALVHDVAALPQLGQVHSRVLYAQTPLVSEPQTEPEAALRSTARYQNFLDEVTCGELGPPGTGEAICGDLVTLLRGEGGGGRDPRSLRFAIELPLHRPALARELELRFYLDLCSRLIAPARPTWTLFWKLGGPEAGSLTLCFREPTIDVFCAILRPHGPSRGTLLPGRRGVGGPPAGAVAVSADLPLRRLLDSLTPAGSCIGENAAAPLRAP